MTRHLLAAAALTAALEATTAARAATVIDFNEYTHGGVTKVYNQPLATKGFTFTSSYEVAGLGFWGSSHFGNPDKGGAALLNWTGGGTTTVRRTDGGLFSLASLDLADAYDNGAPNDVLFTFFDGVSTTTELFAIDRLKGLQTALFDRGSLEWFSYRSGASGVQIDNVRVAAPVVSAVPEPATWAMMILGLGGVGAVLRTRRREGLATV